MKLPPPRDEQLAQASALVSCIAATMLGQVFSFRVARDVKRPEDGRIFIQCTYTAPCSVTCEPKEWHGRKWYLSDHMTHDEIVKTCFAAFKATVEHEVMEGFTFMGSKVFNPHAHFNALIEASKDQVFRKAHS